MKTIKYLLPTIFLFLICISPVKGLESIVDFNKKGSIKIILENETSKIEGMELSLYSIATVTSKDNNLYFEYKEELNTCEVSLNNLDDNNIVNELTNCVKGKNPIAKKSSNELGIIEFNDLELGLYLIKQESKKEGYSTTLPFLVILPTIENDTWIYSVESTPKTDIYELIDITVNKVWNSKRDKIPENVTIALYNDKQLLDTITLNNDNKWTYTWNDLEKSDTYSVLEINVPKDYTASYKQNNYTFTVTNTDTLPNTGQLYYSIIVSAALGLIFLLLGFIQLKKGNYDE